MDNKANMELDTEILQQNIIRQYMIYQGGRIINKLHKLYPEEFNKMKMDLELEILQKYLNKCNITINTEEAINNMLSQRSKRANKASVNRPILEDNARCCARVWDIKCIKIVDKDGKYVNYGRRCTRPRIAKKHGDKVVYLGDYCNMHKRKPSHGDFREPNVPKYLENHFENAAIRFGSGCIVHI